MSRRFGAAEARPLAFLMTLGLAALSAAPAQADPGRVTVRGNGAELKETPIVARLKTGYGPGRYRYKMQPKGDGPAIPAQIYQEGDAWFLAFVLKGVPARGELVFSLESDSSPEEKDKGVAFRPDGKNLEITVDGKPLTVYRVVEPTKPYYYPLIGPTGDSFTRSFPMKRDVPGETKDHPHQRSLWFTYGNLNGYDFWASDPNNKPNPKLPFGQIHETSRKIVAEGPAVGVLKTTDDWLGPDGARVCQDERVVRFYGTEGIRVVDFDVTMKATDGPVTFNDTKEGMFGLRVASSMDVAKGKAKGAGRITNAEGLHDDAAWGKASPWVDYVGPVEGKAVGVAILNHPESFRYPTTWHVRTYGLFAANPFGWHDFGMGKTGQYTIPKGEQVRFRYRVILHRGDTTEAQIADAFKAYAQPPAVELERE